MSKDFNSDMFSAILKANENSMSLLEKQLEATQKQAKRKDIIYCITIIALVLLLGGLTYAYHQKKAVMNVDYDQDTKESVLTDSNISYDNKVTAD